MKWQEVLSKFEHNKQWDDAILFMRNVIAKNPNDMDAYISMNYLLMNLLADEKHDESKNDYYAVLAQQYFDDSYAKFSENPEYLFFTGVTASISEWYFGIDDIEDVNNMLKKASRLNPDNMLYLWGKHMCLNARNPENIKLINSCAAKILAAPSLVEFLKSKGAVGEYILQVQLTP